MRSRKTGKLYWIGNISRTAPKGNSPRYPLYIAEINEEAVALRKQTLAVIEDYDPQRHSLLLQLSNFHILENRETLDIELYATLLGERGDGQKHGPDFWAADAYKYTIRL